MIVISDLHLGPGDSRDDFHADDELIEFLRRHKNEIIIVNGDVFELWQAPRAEIEVAHATVCQAIEDYATYVIIGNHDNRAETLCGHHTFEAITYKGLYVTHGHRFDMFNSGPLGWVGRLGSLLAGLAEIIHKDADYWLMDKAQRIRGVGRYSDPDRYRQEALSLVRKTGGIERVVLGHTHKWAAMDAGYGNCGTWTGGHRDFLRVEV